MWLLAFCINGHPVCNGERLIHDDRLLNMCIAKSWHGLLLGWEWCCLTGGRGWSPDWDAGLARPLHSKWGQMLLWQRSWRNQLENAAAQCSLHRAPLS